MWLSTESLAISHQWTCTLSKTWVQFNGFSITKWTFNRRPNSCDSSTTTAGLSSSYTSQQLSVRKSAWHSDIQVGYCPYEYRFGFNMSTLLEDLLYSFALSDDEQEYSLYSLPLFNYSRPLLVNEGTISLLCGPAAFEAVSKERLSTFERLCQTAEAEWGCGRIDM